MGRKRELVKAVSDGLTPKKPTKRIYFPKVKAAREILREKALDLLAKYELIIDQALAKEDFETAAKHTQWLLEHLPNEDGERIIDPSAAKVPESNGSSSGPTIQIGIALGPSKVVKELPPIEAEVIKNG